MKFNDVAAIYNQELRHDGTLRKPILLYITKQAGYGYCPLNYSHMSMHLGCNWWTCEKWIRELVREELLAKNIFTEFGELRAIVRLNKKALDKLIDKRPEKGAFLMEV